MRALLQEALDALETTYEVANSGLYGDNQQSIVAEKIRAKLAEDVRVIDQPKLTHGMGCEWAGKDGVKRYLHIGKFDNGSINIGIQTWWDGEEAEPMTTNLGLGPEAFSVLTDAILTFQMRMNEFEVKDETEEKP
jgi:hypothetical protein